MIWFQWRRGGNCNLNDYDVIGVASGVYQSKLHKDIIRFMEENKEELSKKDVFAIITSGSSNKKYLNQFVDQMKHYKIQIKSTFRSPGFDTFGPFKYIGGIQKGHPNEADGEAANHFIKQMIKGE